MSIGYAPDNSPLWGPPEAWNENLTKRLNDLEAKYDRLRKAAEDAVKGWDTLDGGAIEELRDALEEGK